MLEKGMLVKSPFDKEFPNDPRCFIVGKVKEVDQIGETVTVEINDPFGYKKYFIDIPSVMPCQINQVEHCELLEETIVLYRHESHIVLKACKNGRRVEYYIRNNNSKKIYKVDEGMLEVSFNAGTYSMKSSLKNYFFQNPMWYFGRQMVNRTMNVLNHSIYGLKDLAGCKIYLKSYQMNTIMHCLQNMPCRYMIADEVGLGKTIEACSILKLFLKDHSGQKILIAVPKELVSQWRTELLFKFYLYEGLDSNENRIVLKSVEDLNQLDEYIPWNFILVDEVHNYLDNESIYNRIHSLSRKTEHVLLLSATPFQQRQIAYLKLLKLIEPSRYDNMPLEQFEQLLKKQKKIMDLAYKVVDEIDVIQSDYLVDLEEDEDPHDNEEVIEELDALSEYMEDLSDFLDDEVVREKINEIDYSAKNLGIPDILTVVSYVCQKYQLSHRIIRNRRSLLGIYPKDPEGEFSERKLEFLDYTIDEQSNYYEYVAYQELERWIIEQQNQMSVNFVEKVIKPLLTSFFSSPWAYITKINKLFDEGCHIDKDVMRSGLSWWDNEREAYNDIADLIDEPKKHPTRLVKLLNYIDTNLSDKKIVLFTNFTETYQLYFNVLTDIFGDEHVTGFSRLIEDRDEAELNIYRFQTEPKCKILVCDRSGGEGRNLQAAEFVVHIDLPWNINDIEQRIGRLDRIGREVTVPATSVVICAKDTYEEQLFKFWDEGLNVFRQSLSGLEIIMNELNASITDTIRTDFEYGLYNTIPELIDRAKKMRTEVFKEQAMDKVMREFEPIYQQVEKTMNDYQRLDNGSFDRVMMSWAGLAGFRASSTDRQDIVKFTEKNFSAASAYNTFLVPPDWTEYLAKKQNEATIKVQRGYEERVQHNITNNNRSITGTFDRDIAIKNDYIHFYAPGDEIFDCIVNNAMQSYKGMVTAFAVKANINWRGFIATYNVSLDRQFLIENDITDQEIGSFQCYLPHEPLTVLCPLKGYDAKENEVMRIYESIVQLGTNAKKMVDHFGQRGKKEKDGYVLNVKSQYHVSNSEYFKLMYKKEDWEKLVDTAVKILNEKARKSFTKKYNQRVEAQKQIDSQLALQKASDLYYGNKATDYEALERKFELIKKGLTKCNVKLDAICFVWMVNNG